jgi:hypothetical protein
MKSIVALCFWLCAFGAAAETLTLDCRVQYQKDGDLWHRAVTLIYAQKKLITVKIDEQPVYTFQLAGTSVMSSVDSERIRIEFDKNKTTWRSSMRDRDFGNGTCIKLPQK